MCQYIARSEYTKRLQSKKQSIAKIIRHNPEDKLLALIAKGLQEHASQVHLWSICVIKLPYYSGNICRNTGKKEGCSILNLGHARGFCLVCTFCGTVACIRFLYNGVTILLDHDTALIVIKLQQALTIIALQNGVCMIKFIFDLDGTITKAETLPIIADHFNIHDQIEELTKETIAGNIPFVESFIRRVHMLSNLPVSEISDLLFSVELYPQLHSFIQEHKEDCIITTGNLWCWVDRLCEKVGCKTYSSSALVENNNIAKLTKILQKDKIVIKYKNEGHKVVFIGDGNNDMEAMRQADISIASGLLHYPAKSILTIADYSIFSEEALCRLLRQLNCQLS